MRNTKFRIRDKRTNEIRDCASIRVYMHPEDGSLQSGGITVDDIYQKEQFTGLKDKNGVEIYEGDIVKTTYENERIEAVEWTEIGFTPMQEPCDYDEKYLCSGDIEVIGNIYEHKHLIGEG